MVLAKATQTTGNRARRNRRNRRRRQTKGTNQPVVVVARPRAPRRRRRRGGSTGGGDSVTTNFTHITDTLKGDAVGAVKFGPSSPVESFTGFLKIYQRYRVLALTVQWVSAASSTDRGVLAYHIDTSCKGTGQGVKPLTCWPLRSGGTRAYGEIHLGSQVLLETSVDQFYFLYKGSGAAETAGFLKLTFRCQFVDRK